MLQLASILVLGIFAQWLAWKIKQPAILPLIIIGLLIGPVSTYFTPDGAKLIDGDNIFNGDLLFSFVSISVGVILFEGGLTLNIKEVTNLAGTVRNLLIVGMIITFVGGGLAAHYILGISYRISFLFGGLILVSGPTVILPILRNVKPNAKINTILKWEGILIDPIGALVAVLVYEFITNTSPGKEYTFDALKEFFITISSGIFMGALASLLLWWLLNKNLLPQYLRNVFTLGLVIMAFAAAELIHKEAGLMAATFMGIVLANTKLEEIKKILSFKEDISLILISVLFILLSSRIELDDILSLGWKSIVVFAIVVFILRPLAVFLSTIRSDLKFKEKLFISWIGPKGIVAAAVASLFSLELNVHYADYHVDKYEAQLLLPLTFLIIVGTVVLQGSSAKWVATKLDVQRKIPQGLLFVGGSEMVRRIALQLQEEGFYVLVADSSKAHINEAAKIGLNTYEGNVLSDGIFEELDLSQIGKMLAITSNSAVNALAVRWFEKEMGDENVLRLVSKEESENRNIPLGKNVLFNSRIDFVNLTQLARDNGKMKLVEFASHADAEQFFKINKSKITPLFSVFENQMLKPFCGDIPSFSKGDKLFYFNNSQINSEPHPPRQTESFSKL